MPLASAPPPQPLPRKSYFILLEVEGVLCQIHDAGRAAREQPPPKMPPSEEDFDPGKRHAFGGFFLRCRPGMRTFLKGLTERALVGVWTRLPADVARPVVEFLFHAYVVIKDMHILTLEDCLSVARTRPQSECTCKPGATPVERHRCRAHPLDYECDPSLERVVYYPFAPHPQGRLRLKVLHQTFWRQSRFRSKDFRPNSSNTVLVDCSRESSILNPWYNAVHPRRYFGKLDDTFLEDKLKPCIGGLLGSGLSVTQYLSRNPLLFGRGGQAFFNTRIGQEVFTCAAVQDRSLVLYSPDYVGNYSRTWPDGFL